MSADPGVKVLFIAGVPRNGSTLLSRLLGELDGFTNVGEAARFLFNANQFGRGLPCGCGVAVCECEVWSRVTPRVSDEVRTLATEFVRIRRMPWMLSPFKSRQTLDTMSSVTQAMGEVYQELQRRLPSRVIVDSSKNPANGFLLARTPGIELYVVHLVRDAREVVGSWNRPKDYLRGFSPARAMAWWWTFNLGSELLRRRSKGYLRLRYEDFISDPSAALARIAELLSESMGSISFLSGNVARISRQHLLAGNPDRDAPGDVTISKRRRPLARPLRVLVTATTLPLLARYGYQLRSSDES